MNAFALLSLFAFVECIVIGVYVYAKASREKLNILFLITCLANGIRAFVEYGYRQSESLTAAQFWQSIDVFWPFASLTLFHFVVSYTQVRAFNSKLMKRVIFPALYVIALLLSGIEILSDFITGPPRQVYWGWTYGAGTIDFLLPSAST
ncbi:MAG: hypothetical protein EHM28_11120, partial [Spirochaetaceae bacterium]